MKRPLLSALLTLIFLGFVACDSVEQTTGVNANPRLDVVALGSCNVQLLWQDFWTQIASDNPDLFLYLGDNIYGDLDFIDGQVRSGPGRPELMAAAYTRLGASALFQSFRNSVPIYPVWDDHDYGDDDAGASYVNREDSERQFLDFWEIPQDDERRTRPGIYSSSMHGPVGERVQIILLDTRFFRSDLVKDPVTTYLNIPTDDKTTTVLGDDQWVWLKEELKREADVRLIVSSIQVHAQGHQFERWGNFPHELERLYTLVDETRANGVVFLSGDRHSAGLYVKRREDHYPLFELTSSSLNSPSRYSSAEETGPNQLGQLYDPANYATLAFDWPARTLLMQIKDISGEVVRTARLEIDELR